MSKRVTLTLSMALCLGLSVPALAEYQDAAGYTAGEGATIFCDAERHDLLPTTDPEPEEPGYLPAWLLSGEPECAYADARNELEDERMDQGLGGTAFVLPEGTLATSVEVRTVDEAFGPDASYLRLTVHTSAGTASAEGCGPQRPVLTDDKDWGSGPGGPPTDILWVGIPPVGIEPDLDVCFASHGVATAMSALH